MKVLPSKVFLKTTQKVKSRYVLKLYIYLNTILAICPFKGDSLRSRLYSSTLFGAYISLTVYTFIIRIFFYPVVLSLFEQVLAMAAIGTLVVFFTNFLFISFRSRESWKSLLTMLVMFDRTLPRDKLKLNKKWSTLLFVLSYVVPISYSINDCIIWREVDPELFILDLSFHVTHHTAIFYEFQITCFLLEISNLLQSRYRYLEECVDRMVLGDEVNRLKLQYSLEIGIKKLKHKYKILHGAVVAVNSILGLTIILMVIHLTLIFLLDFYWMIYSLEMSGIIAIEGVLFMAMVTVSYWNNIKVLLKFRKPN